MSKLYPNLLHCFRCDAHYQPGGWTLGLYRGTSDQFIPVRKLDDNDCPICRKPPLLEKPLEVTQYL